MPDNFNKIRNHLNFTSDDDYYLLEILLRKKDFPEEEREKIKDHRTLATYLVDSLEKFNAIEAEVKMLCKLHNARAYFNLDKKSKKKTTMLLMHSLMNMIENNDYHNLNSRLTSAAGQCSGIKDGRKFLIDVDEKSLNLVISVIELIETVSPDTLHDIIPSVNGYHIVTTPFNVQKFNNLGGKDLQNVEIKHNSPTILYYDN